MIIQDVWKRFKRAYNGRISRCGLWTFNGTSDASWPISDPMYFVQSDASIKPIFVKNTTTATAKLTITGTLWTYKSVASLVIPPGAWALLIPDNAQWNVYQSVQQGQNSGRVSSNAGATYTATIYDSVVLMDATAQPQTVTIPSAAAAFVDGIGQELMIKKIDSSANAVSYVRAGSDTIEGGTGASLPTQWKSVTLHAISATAWVIKSTT